MNNNSHINGEEVIKFTPDQLGYKDRGIVKWQGLMLSDHLEALKKEKEYNQLLEIEAKEEMTENEIGDILYKAYISKSPILIQANVLKNGNYYKDLKCKVTGYIDNQIYFILKDGRSVNCTLEQIRNVEYMNVLHWYNKE